jgi:hypothetical protein
MPNVTLVMTRRPLHEFLWIRGRHEHYEDIDDTDDARTARFGPLDHGIRSHAPAAARGLISGQWSTMAVVEGPMVYAVQRTAEAAVNVANALGTAGWNFPVPVQLPSFTTAQTTVNGQPVYLVTDGTAIARTTQLDALERFRTNSKAGFYVRIPPRPNRAYGLKCYNADVVADFHRRLGIRTSDPGMCLLVQDHDVKQENGELAGILLHEAPHPGWLTGCIGPRLPGNRGSADNVRVCIDALDIVYRAMGGFSYGKTARLFVFD